MSRLVIIVEVDADPTLHDPMEIGEAPVLAYIRLQTDDEDEPDMDFVSAEWQAGI